MKALKILVVEDDYLLAYRIGSDLSRMGYEVIGPAHNSGEAIKLYEASAPSLVLMDIDLNDSELDGIQIAEVINARNPIPIIFLSGLGGRKTLNRARSVKPAYYLVKPCTNIQLQVAIDFAIQNFVENKAADEGHSLKYHVPLSNVIYGMNDCFFIKRELQYVRIDIKDIVFIKAESPGNNIIIVTEYTEELVLTGMKYFTKQIRHSCLMRINRSFIVNVDKIVAFDAKKVVVNRQRQKLEISIGNTYKDAFMSSFIKLRTE